MSNKLMLSIELRALLERILSEPASNASYGNLRDRAELRALLDKPASVDLVECDACPTSGGCVSVCMKSPKPAAQHQGEPVRWERMSKMMGGAWWPCANKAEADEAVTCGWTVRPLYAEQPAPVAVVMPERETYTKYLVGVIPHNANEVNAYKDGWNTCLEEVARLNGVKQ